MRTSDADAAARRVEDAGGTVLMGPFEIPGEAGRMAVCRDSGGAAFSIFQPKRHKGAELVNEVGAWTWNNLLTRDLDGAKRFYGAVFGWEATHNEGAPEQIMNWQLEGQRWPEGLGGLMGIPDQIPSEAPPYWEVYLAVEDLDRAVETTKGAGGRLLVGPLEIPVGRIAALSDPQGAVFSLTEPDYPEPR
ncbi:MAG TPA: VOC family protein [Solirubrobacterales bacterium]|nr:VOC family protein [Solirubrobacterales bacterium]